MKAIVDTVRIKSADLKIIFCSRVLRLSVRPSCRERPQTAMLLIMVGEIKVPPDQFRCVLVVFLYVTKVLERFSFECRKVIGFAITTLRDWLKRFAPLFHPIRSKTKTNRNAFACIFPRFASATCNYFEF